MNWVSKYWYHSRRRQIRSVRPRHWALFVNVHQDCVCLSAIHSMCQRNCGPPLNLCSMRPVLCWSTAGSFMGLCSGVCKQSRSSGSCKCDFLCWGAGRKGERASLVLAHLPHAACCLMLATDQLHRDSPHTCWCVIIKSSYSRWVERFWSGLCCLQHVLVDLPIHPTVDLVITSGFDGSTSPFTCESCSAWMILRINLLNC